MDYDDDSFDQEQMTKLINSQISMLNDKFKLYDKMIYEENPNKGMCINNFYGFYLLIYSFKTK